MKKKVTIKDVASAVGVSPATVSRVISNSSKISEKTKIKVREVIKKLNYNPNIMARGLVNRKTKILGVIMPKETADLFASPFFIEVMRGISSKAKKYDYYIMYDFCKSEDDELNATQKITSGGLVDGVCLLTVRTEDRCIKYLEEKNIPFVVLGEPKEKDEILWVDNNNFEATYEMVKKMSCGEKVIFIGGNENLTVTVNRRKGFEKACKDLKIDGEVYIAKEFTKDEGYKIGEKIYKESKCRKFIVTDDNLLNGFLGYLDEENDQEAQIYGFNKINLRNKWKKRVKIVDIKPEKLGEEVIKLLIKNIENVITGNKVLVEIDVN